jgi:uncharacterized protein YjbI with pentapeptide repeats
MTREEILAAVAAGADLSGADLSGADLYRADLTGANLTGADIYHANLYRADLFGANLTGADIYHANLYRADLFGANLTGANLHRTRGIVSASGVGSERRTVYAWHGPDGWVVRAGCWTGSTAELRERVATGPWEKASDAETARWTAQYVAFCDLVDATATEVAE